jgi:uncharacterized protein YjbI with pentapeptide repeats
VGFRQIHVNCGLIERTGENTMKTLSSLRSGMFGVCTGVALCFIASAAWTQEAEIANAAVTATQEAALDTMCGVPAAGWDLGNGPYYNNCDDKNLQGVVFAQGSIGGGPGTWGTATPQFLHAHLEGATLAGAGMGAKGNLAIMFNYAFLTGTNLSQSSLNASQFMHVLGEHAIFTGCKGRAAN